MAKHYNPNLIWLARKLYMKKVGLLGEISGWYTIIPVEQHNNARVFVFGNSVIYLSGTLTPILNTNIIFSDWYTQCQTVVRMEGMRL